MLGLLIGGIVAFFIPRYYVSDTIIAVLSAAVLKRTGPGKDPLRDAVVPDGADLDPVSPSSRGGHHARVAGGDEWLDIDDRRTFIAEVKSRVQLNDLERALEDARSAASPRSRSTYRDTDGTRARQGADRHPDQ